MNKNPEESRERMRQEELKRPTSSIRGSALSDLVGSLDWKGTLILLFVIVVVFVILRMV